MVHRMAKPKSSFDASDVVRLGELAGISLAAEDAEALAGALAGHCDMVAPLFEFRLEDAPVATIYDPHWRG